jgi:hypothetical protein
MSRACSAELSKKLSIPRAETQSASYAMLRHRGSLLLKLAAHTPSFALNCLAMRHCSDSFRSSRSMTMEVLRF